ncbi:hypothetical protein DFH06DRAFT_53945 [Mycena polygramma]|nr:hypothetical protein DFH06DRAFT_53945 [Mycena polygramma]
MTEPSITPTEPAVLTTSPASNGATYIQVESTETPSPDALQAFMDAVNGSGGMACLFIGEDSPDGLQCQVLQTHSVGSDLLPLFRQIAGIDFHEQEPQSWEPAAEPGPEDFTERPRIVDLRANGKSILVTEDAGTKKFLCPNCDIFRSMTPRSIQTHYRNCMNDGATRGKRTVRKRKPEESEGSDINEEWVDT